MAARVPLHDLSVGAARALYQFVYAPGLHADPVRLKALLGEGDFEASDPYVNQLVRERLEIGDASEFEADDPVHRVALLPRGDLAALAWRLGLVCNASRLRRLIRREELAALGRPISDQDWRLVAEQSVDPDDVDPLDAIPVEALGSTCRRAGWQVLAHACDHLPADIGERLRLKLPDEAVVAPHGRPPLPWACFSSACAAVDASDPHREALWASSPSAS